MHMTKLGIFEVGGRRQINVTPARAQTTICKCVGTRQPGRPGKAAKIQQELFTNFDDVCLGEPSPFLLKQQSKLCS